MVAVDPVPSSDTTARNWLEAAQRAYSKGDYSDALRFASEALALDHALIEGYVILAELASQQPNGAAIAERVLRKALAISPSSFEVQRLLAHSLLLQGQLLEAFRMLEALFQRGDRDPLCCLPLARLQESRGQPARAEQTLFACHHVHRTAAPVRNAFADLRKRQGRLVEALSWHRQAVGGEPWVPRVSQRPHIVFLAQYPAAWPSVAPVYQAFTDDPTWRVTVVAMPFLHSQFSSDEERNAIFPYLANNGIPFQRWDEFRMGDVGADVALLHLPYDETLPVGWKLDDLLRTVVRIVYLPYALVIVGGSENTRSQFDLPIQQKCWMVVAHSSRDRELYRSHCSTGHHHVQLVGHPKLDPLLQLDSHRDPVLDSFTAGRKTVCWNPHFDLRPDYTRFGTGLSTFLAWHELMLDEMQSRPDLAFIVRPHPLFFGSLQQRGIWSRKQCECFIDRLHAAGNAYLDLHPSYLRAFSHSSALISDASSLLLEFALTCRPILYLRNQGGPPLNANGNLIREHFYTADEAAGIRQFLDQIVTGSDPRQSRRAAAVREYLQVPSGGAGPALKAVISARLERERALSSKE